MKYSNKFLVNLYRTMVRIRLCEESLVDPILRGEVRCPVHLYSGEEAIAVGVCAAIKESDYVFSTHRSHGHYLAKGGGMPELIAEVYTKKTGCSRGRGGSMHLVAPQVGMMGSAPIVGGTIPLAVGAALAASIRKDKRIVVSFFGDGAAGEGVLYESLNFAALKRLPIIFVCENNLYSTHMPICECRPKNDIFDIGNPFCIKSYQINGNDVLAVFESAKRAVGACRNGDGPVFLEFMTYRLRGHVGPDDNIQGSRTDIRPKEEIERWRKKDPVRRFEQYLITKNILNEKDLQKIKEGVENEVSEAHDFAKNSPYSHESELTNYVFQK
jgi:pyruvate dehydrogenase E1 component alpha subunit